MFLQPPTQNFTATEQDPSVTFQDMSVAGQEQGNHETSQLFYRSRCSKMQIWYEKILLLHKLGENKLFMLTTV